MLRIDLKVTTLPSLCIPYFVVFALIPLAPYKI